MISSQGLRLYNINAFHNAPTDTICTKNATLLVVREHNNIVSQDKKITREVIILVTHEKECKVGTFYNVDEKFAASIHRRLQQWAKNQRWAKCNNIQSIFICIFQGCLFSHNLGNRIPVLPVKSREWSQFRPPSKKNISSKKTSLC